MMVVPILVYVADNAPVDVVRLLFDGPRHAVLPPAVATLKRIITHYMRAICKIIKSYIEIMLTVIKFICIIAL